MLHIEWNDSSQLEDWLTDIENASELMGKSRTKLAQAESKGLVRMLISEALTLNKLLNKLEDSCQTYINYYKTHLMAIAMVE